MATLAAAVLALAGAAPAGNTLELTVRGTELTIERPATWRAGGVSGLGILHNYIGSADGLPGFSVQTDPEAALEPAVPDDQVEARIEALFEAIAVDRRGARVETAGWRSVNGLRLHDSLASHSSPAGRIVNRRLILVHEGLPYIFTWSSRESDWPEIVGLVEGCAGSLRAADATGVIAD